MNSNFLTVIEVINSKETNFPDFYSKPSDYSSKEEMRELLKQAKDFLTSNKVKYIVRRSETIEESSTRKPISLREFLKIISK